MNGVGEKGRGEGGICVMRKWVWCVINGVGEKAYVRAESNTQ